MLNKLLVALLSINAVSAFAMRNNLFQEFDNQVSIGYGMNQTISSFGYNPSLPPKNNIITTNSSIVNLEVERLLNNGVWININANMAFGAGPLGTFSPYQNPNDYGINGKVGYAFTMAGNQHLQITPYGLVGVNNTTNLTPAAVASNPQVANMFAYRAGVGGMIEYRINRVVLLFADQLAAYNWDQSGPTSGIQPQNNMMFISTLGAKFNVVKNFQIGVKGFYTNYQPQASNAGVSMNGSGGAPYFAQPQNSLGGLVSVGLTY